MCHCKTCPWLLLCGFFIVLTLLPCHENLTGSGQTVACALGQAVGMA
jgi:hypothetical protein